MTPEDAAKTASQIRSVLAKDSILKPANRSQDSSDDVFSIRELVCRVAGYVHSIGVKFQRNLMKFIQFHGFKSTSTKEGEL
jgi:hypothetical protein|nr:MAG TPA: hypothetical protein [Caudoviricetes sp.]